MGIQLYIFAGSSNSAGNISPVYSDYCINGELKKVEYYANNFTATGSLWLGISGAISERVWLKKNNLDSNSSHYIFSYAEDSNSNSGSPQVFVRPIALAPLYFAGSGLGNTKIGKVFLYY